MKFPNEEFLKHCKTNSIFCDGANNRLDRIKHEVSPCRAATHQQAAKMMDDGQVYKEGNEKSKEQAGSDCCW